MIKPIPSVPTKQRAIAHQPLTQDISARDHMMKRSFYILAFLLASLTGIALAAPPSAPTGVCIQSTEGVECATTSSGNTTTPSTSSSSTAGLFPGTNLKFRPGFVISATENESPSATESNWQELFTASPNRKVSYRPKGIYGAVTRRLEWKRFYFNQNVRPQNPTNHTDPAYNWSLLDAIFNINAVKNEGALVVIEAREVGYGNTTYAAPSWLINEPYNGGYISTSGATRAMPQYYRYSGPDARGFTNVGPSPAIVDEYLYFQRAMRDHLVATGNIDKVMGIQTSEFYGGGDSSFETDFYHGVGTRAKKLAEIWAEEQIPVFQSSISGGSTMTSILAQYVNTTLFGLTFPDMKLQDTGQSLLSRFSINGVYQKDIRPLSQATESNGLRGYTTFASGVPNPWGYSNVTVPQTPSHILWALSGSPKGTTKDSGLGQPGDDPAGILPTHIIKMSWDRADPLSPTVSDWHKAIDTFGPPGTFAFPYLPPGYVP